MTPSRKISLCLLLALLLIGCNSQAPAKVRVGEEVAVVVESRPLMPSTACADEFVTHELPHTTSAGSPTRLFDSNGSGLAINDLDNDGDLDIVLANLKGDNSILWNEGQLTFRHETLPYGGSRAVAIVDVEGDGWPDIIFTRGSNPPLHWRHLGLDETTGESRFEHQPLSGVSHPAYAMNWADLDADGDLDLVTGSYDAALMLEQANDFLFGQGGGVFLYQQEDETWLAQQLAEEAQALALSLADFNGDDQPDIAVGNDFDLPDGYWEHNAEGWQEVTPFDTTTHSTMSFDQADLNNDGQLEWFATDMKPYEYDTKTLAAWLPLMEDAHRAPGIANDPQWRENMLHQPNQSGGYRNNAYAQHLDATGWSWSGKFGDLDRDGFLDLYVVNGMIAEDLLPHLPGGELVEANQALRNDGEGAYVPMPTWQLGSTASGRGMSMADLDADGDLDIVVNNLNSPSLLFENKICSGQALEVDLFWPQSKNQRALGAILQLHTSSGRYIRDVRALSGYLSGDPARLHFGIPTDSQLHQLDIFWPDGTQSTINQPMTNSLLSVRRPSPPSG